MAAEFFAPGPAANSVDRVLRRHEQEGAPALAPVDVQRRLAALQVTLDTMAAPAIVLDLDGELLLANADAEAALGPDPRAAARGLVNGSAVAGGSTLAWNLTPLGRANEAIGFLAVPRAPPTDQALHLEVSAAVERWKLTARQAEVLYLVVHGLTNDLVAERLGIIRGTVEYHLSAIFDKAGVSNRATLIVRVLEGAQRR